MKYFNKNITYLGPCMNFQKRLLSKKYTMNVLHEKEINQPPFMGFNNFKDVIFLSNIFLLSL